MSTGVGGGLVLGGRLHRGAHGAGEIGHAPVEWDGAACACGLRGCLEAYVGGAAWTRHLRAEAPEAGRVAALAGGRDAITPRHLLAAAREGDDFALTELARWNGYLARAIVWLAMVLSPEVVVLGTIARAAGEELCLAPVRELVARHLWREEGQAPRIVAAELGETLGERAGLAVAALAAERAGGRTEATRAAR
jgi:glucokinase